MEKTAFLLEQMRLCVDNSDWVRTEIAAQKMSKKLLAQPEYQVNIVWFDTLKRMVCYFEEGGVVL